MTNLQRLSSIFTMTLTPASLLVSLLMGGVGYVAFVYGKRQRRFPQLITGLVLMIYPYFVPNPLVTLVIGTALLALMWLAIYLGL